MTIASLSSGARGLATFNQRGPRADEARPTREKGRLTRVFAGQEP
jgi:hypothetical protein